MNKWLKITGIALLSIFAFLYIAFLVLPYMVKLDNYIPMLQEIVKEQTNLNLEVKNPRLVTTPILEAGFKTDGIKITLDDGTPVLDSDGIKAKVFLPSVSFLTVRVSCLELHNPKITLDTNPQATQYLLIQEIENMLNRLNTQKLQQPEEENGWFNPEWIRIIVPNIKITNYNIAVNDKKVNHSLTLRGDELRLGYFNGKKAKLKTYAYLMSDDKENITANLKINTFLPKSKKEQLDPDDDKAQKIEIPFVNIVKIYQNYDLKAHINSKIKIRQKRSGKVTANGSFDIDNLTLRLANYQLPKCYFHSVMRGTTADINTSFYVTPTEKATVLGKIDYNKPAIDLVLGGDKIYFNDLIIFSKAVLDSFGIRNDFENLKGSGYIQSDAQIKTNFKKLKSNGKIIIRDGALINNKIGLLITGTNSDLIFDDNIFRIKDTKTFIGGKPLTINGTIDSKAKANLNANTQNMPIVGLYNAFAPSDLKKSIKMKSGNISLDAKINGKLQKSLSSIKFDLGNLGISTQDNSVNISNGNFSLTVMYDLAENILKGNITNKDFSLTLPQTKSVIQDKNLAVNFNNEVIKLLPTDILINSASKIKLNGQISDYQKTPIINIDGNGSLVATDLRKFAGDAGAPYIDAKGRLPLKFSLTGNDKKQFFVAQVVSNANSYITPVHFKNLIGKQCISQLKIAYKGDRLNIKDTGIFISSNPFTNDYNDNISGAETVIKTHGTLAKLDTIEPRFNLFKLEIPNSLEGTIYALRRSRFNLNGGVLVIGKVARPFIHGGVNVDNVNIPTLLTKIKSAGVDFNGYSMRLFADEVDLNGSKLNVSTQSNFEFAPVAKFFKLDVQSDDFDLDKVMKVADAAAKNLPAQPSNDKASSKEEILPLEVTGRFLLKRIKTGNIILNNTRGRLSLARNVLTIRPMMTNCFKGVVRGRIDTNIVTGAISMDLKGNNLDVEQALADAANTKDAISGTASFDMKADLKGSTYEEQMKSLTGNVHFNIINGSYGPIGKIENLILAENIRNSQFFQTALGGIINNIATIDSAHFSELRGLIKFKDGKAILTPITSQGNVMCLHIAGSYDLLKNEADMKVRGKMGSFLSEMLGPIAMLNPVNLVKATPGINIVMAKAFSLFTVSITPEEMKAIPNFAKTSTSDTAATKFQIILQGDAAKPLSMIKSFKWLATPTEIDMAKNFTENMPEEYLLADPTTPEAQAKAKEDAKLINKIKRKFKG
ncbi:MAG: hypothetical protein K6E29_03500 [Cyanobacteria bacterium RUI128]|nr:hypothetical protein [Cyanobacteria bacterium RUI128]